MTRETKIGLLVALAFVIAVGVLLSDHMVNNSDAKPAAVAVAGPEVVRGLAVPGQAASDVAVPVQPEPNASPANTVPSTAELTAPAPEAAKSTIVIGGPTKNDQIEIAAASPNVPQRSTGIIITPPVEAMVSTDPGVHVSTLSDLSSAAQLMVAPLAAATTQPTQRTYQEYVAVSGDNVAKWARKFLGADTKANRDLIIAANDVLKKDPAKIVVGKTYRIPFKVAPAPAPGPAPAPMGIAIAPGTQPIASVPATTVAPSAAAPAAAKTYVVKSGDNLWKISKGNPRLANEIRKLNRDAFKGENLKVGATLRLPTSGSAS